MAAEWVEQGKRTLANLIKAYEDKLLIVVFYVRWCKPCRRLLAALPIIAQQAGEKLAICPINVEETQNYYASREHKATNVPITLFFQKGREICRIPGLVETEDLLHRINCYQKKKATL
jgi:thioredoxin 1